MKTRTIEVIKKVTFVQEVEIPEYELDGLDQFEVAELAIEKTNGGDWDEIDEELDCEVFGN